MSESETESMLGQGACDYRLGEKEHFMTSQSTPAPATDWHVEAT